MSALVDLLRRYSHFPDLLYDLRTAIKSMGEVAPNDHSGEVPGPQHWALTDRLSPADVQVMADLHAGGVTYKELAVRFKISLKSVQRLLRAHRRGEPG